MFVLSDSLLVAQKSWALNSSLNTASTPPPVEDVTEEPTTSSTDGESRTPSPTGSNPTLQPATREQRAFNTCSHQARVIQRVDTCLELAFLIDVSGSMGPQDLTGALEFTRRLVSFFSFRISDSWHTGARVALLTFRATTQVHLSLENGTSSSAIFQTLEYLHSMRNDTTGDTNLRKALETFRDQVAWQARNRCPQRLLFVLTDGNVNRGGGESSLREVSQDEIIKQYGEL